MSATGCRILYALRERYGFRYQPHLDAMPALHQTRDMRTKLRKVTVSLEEDVDRWARIEAARNEMSVSRLLGTILKERMLQQDSYKRAMRRALSRKPFPKTDGRYYSRDQVHDRDNDR